VEERRWELRPARRRLVHVGGALVLAGIWLPIEAGLLVFTGFLAVGVPSTARPGDQDAPLGWLGVPFGTLGGLYAVFCTAVARCCPRRCSASLPRAAAPRCRPALPPHAVPPTPLPGAVPPVLLPDARAGRDDGGMAEERRWELRPPFGRRVYVMLGVLCGVVWVPVAGVLLWCTAAAAATPFGVGPAVGVFADGPLAVPLASGFGVLAAGWAAAGRGLARWLVRSSASVEVVVDARGVRVERAGRGGRQVLSEVPWHELHHVRLRPGNVLELHGTRGVRELAPVDDPERHIEIERHLDERLAALPDRPPIVHGHQAYLDDRGATLLQSRRNRRVAARWTAGFAVLCGVDAVAVALEPAAGAGLWTFAAALGAAATGLTGATVAFLRWTPRWIARPGAVVLERRLGGGFAFEARTLELVRREDVDGNVVDHQLVAVADADGADGSPRKTVLWHGIEPGVLPEVGAWLARHAEIPFRSRTVRSTPD
jgi:hypothetical protein